MVGLVWVSPEWDQCMDVVFSCPVPHSLPPELCGLQGPCLCALGRKKIIAMGDLVTFGGMLNIHETVLRTLSLHPCLHADGKVFWGKTAGICLKIIKDWGCDRKRQEECVQG